MPELNPQQTAALLAILHGGPAITGEVDIKRSGDQIILPPNMSYDEGIIWLQRKKKEDETWVDISEVIEGFAFDAANAFNLAVKEMFGMKAMDPWRATSQNVKINAAGDTINVFLGDMQVPGLEGTIKIYVTGDWSVTIVFKIRHKDRDKADRLMALARQYVREKSMYKGKAFRLGWKPATMFAPAGFADPEFIPTGMRGQMKVNADTLELVQATVWTPIQKSVEVLIRQYAGNLLAPTAALAAASQILNVAFCSKARTEQVRLCSLLRRPRSQRSTDGPSSTCWTSTGWPR